MSENLAFFDGDEIRNFICKSPPTSANYAKAEV